MRAHAPDQFNERSFAGRPGIEQEWRNVGRARWNDKFFHRSIDIGKVRSVARPTFRGGGDGRAQNLAALHIRGAVFLFGRLGMKRTFAWRHRRPGGERAEDAMIGDDDPGSDRERDGQATRSWSHAGFNRR
jgi:hypothetical protein